jgi:hypothetical protein
VICSSVQQQTFLSAAMANSNICIVASSLSPFCPGGQSTVEPRNPIYTTMLSLTTKDRSRHQDILINVLQTIAGGAGAYCWHSNGDNDAGYNKSSLSNLLGIDHDDMVLIMEKCGYMDEKKTADRFQLEKLFDRIGKESCELMNFQLKNKVDNSRKILYFLQIGLADGLHAVAAPTLLFKKGLFVQLPTQSNCPWLQSESDGIKLLIKSIGERVPCNEETKRQEQTGARGKDSNPHEQTKSLSDLESSEMIQNIVRTISGENKPKLSQRLHRSIRKCMQTYIADASLLLCFSKWDSAITDTTPQQEKGN